MFTSLRRRLAGISAGVQVRGSVRGTLGIRRRPLRLHLEVLEDRLAPAVYVVTDLTDTDPGGNGNGKGVGLNGDLRYCVRQANMNVGSINFQPGLTGIVSLMKKLDDITTNITVITGLGMGNTTIRRDVNAVGDFSIFVIAGQNNTLSSMAIRKGTGTQLGFVRGGGGVYIKPDASAQIVACAITNCTADNGGGVYVDGSATITGTVINGNQATNDGGGIYSDPQGGSSTEVDGGSVIGQNTAQFGGGVYCDRNATIITNSTITINSASQQGGGLYNASSPAAVTGLTVTGCTVVANTASTSGGGVYNQGTATISESTVVANAAFNGGGVYTVGGFKTTVTNTTIYGNLVNNQNATQPLDSSLEGGNVYVESGATFSVVNTIIATPGASGDSPDVYGTIQSLGHNLVFNPTGGSGYAPSDLLGVDPQLGPLQDNGGPTSTRMPLTGSPCIDGGDNNYVDGPYDQRGFTRIQDGIVDIGAVETPYSSSRAASPRVAARILLNDLSHASNGVSSVSGLAVTQASATALASATGQVSATISAPPLGIAKPKATIAQLHGKTREDYDWTAL